MNRIDPGGQFDGLFGTLASIGGLAVLSATVLVATADPANAPGPNSQIYSTSQLQDSQTGVFVIFTSEIGGRAATYGIKKAFGIIGAGLASRALANELQNGVSFLLKESDYLKFVKGKALIGRPDGQFCTTTATMDAAIAETTGEPVALGEKLGLEFKPGEKLYRVDIQDPLSLNPRIPDATMSGVNEDFIPGGKTSGGVPEIAIDQIPSSQFTVYPLH